MSERPPESGQQGPPARPLRGIDVASPRSLASSLWRLSGPWRFRVVFALPLLVFVLLFVAALAPVDWRGWTLLGVAVALLAGVYFVQLPEDATSSVERMRRYLSRVQVRWLAVPVAFVLVAIYLARGVILKHLAPGGSWSALALLVGIALYVLAFGLMLTRVSLDQPGSGLKRSALISVVVLAWPFLSVEGLRLFGFDPPLLIALLVALGAPLAAFVALWAFHARPAPLGQELVAPRTDRLLRKLGAHPEEVAGSRRGTRWQGWCALLAAACAIAASAFFLAAALRATAESYSDDESPIARLGEQFERAPPTDHQELVAFYSPVLRLDAEERWVAGDARAYALDSEFTATSDSCPHPSVLDQGDAPIPAVALCGELDGPGEPAGVDDVSGGKTVFAHGVVYPRIFAIPQPGGAGCIGKRPCRLLDYWLFYPDNVWEGTTSIGNIVQSHEGDWEHVAVGIDAARQPLFVAYSAHCSGSVRTWDRAQAVATTADGLGLVVGSSPDVQRSHPLAVVARGSHANYPTTGRRDADWADCAGLGSVLSLGAGYWSLTANAVERTDPFGPVQVPPVAPLGDSERILTTPWWWGPHERYRLSGIAVKRDEEHGPDSPGKKVGEWTQPHLQIAEWPCEGAGCADLKRHLSIPASADTR